jgi:hypothetical protein
MAKEILFKVKTEGGEEITKVAKSLNDLAIAQKQTQDALNNTKIDSKEYKKLSGDLKDVEKAQNTAKTSTMSFGEKLGNLPGPLGGAAKGFGGLTKASLEFLATPIGAVVGALGLVFAAVTKAVKSNEGAMDALTKVTDTFAGIVQPLFDFLAKVATVVLDGIADGLAAVGDLFGLAGSEAAKFSEELDAQSDIEKDLAVSRAQTNQQLAEAKEILSDSNATYEERVAALNKVKAAEEEQSKKEVENKKELLRLAQEQLSIDGQSEEGIQKIRDAKIALANVEQDAAAKQRQFNKQQKALDKEVQSAEDEKQKEAEARAKEAAAKAKARQDAALALKKEALKAEQKAIDEAYLLSIDDENIRAQEALKIQQRNADAELQIKIDTLNKISKRTKDENAALAALKAQQAAEDIAQAATTDALLEKQRADAQKKKEDDEKKAADDFKKLTEEEYNDTVKSTDEYYTKLNTALIESGKTEQEIKAEQDALELQRLEQQKLNAEDYGKSIVEIDAAIAAKRKEIKDQEVVNAQEAAQKEFDIQQAKLSAVIDGLNIIASATELFAGKTKESQKKAFNAQKAINIATATIQTYQAASAVLAQASLNPATILFPGYPAIQAGIIIAAGLANVAKIAAQKFDDGGSGGGGEGAAAKPSSFANGGYVSGPGSSTSDSIPARLSDGEFVVNAKSTSNFRGLLESINEAGKTKSMGLAAGGWVQSRKEKIQAWAEPNGAGITALQEKVWNLEQDMKNPKPVKTYVVASDMTSQQEADAKIQRIAQL